MKPQRIQRKRTKDWKMPAGAVYVGRPSKWGNPLKCMADEIYIDASYRRRVLDPWVWLCSGNEYLMIALFQGFFDKDYKTDSEDLRHWHDYFKSLDLSELRGKNLACWCPLTDKKGEPVTCHADVLLKLANE